MRIESGDRVRDRDRRARRRNERLLDAQADPELLAARVTNRGPDQIEEVALDPLAREVVRDGDGEDAVLETRAVTSPNQVE